MARTNKRGSSAEDKLEVRPLVIWDVRADNHRSNVALFKAALPTSAEPETLARRQTLVFFGGDIQNLMELMDQSDSMFNYRKWCLESAAVRLARGFPTHNIVIFKPNRVEEEHVSCFDHFVHTDTIGMASYIYEYRTLPYLESLLRDLSRKVRRMDSDTLFRMMLKTEHEECMQKRRGIENGAVWQYENMSPERKKIILKWQKTLRLHTYPLTLIAFAKGCTVLNQLLYELHYSRVLEPSRHDYSFTNLIKAMYWLDSGFCGHRNVYLTSRGLLTTLANLGIKVRVHVSLYMVEDENRPWIRIQCSKFVEILEELKADVLIIRHVSPTEDIDSHLNVLLRFKFVEDSHSKNIKSPKVRINVKLPTVEQDEELTQRRRRRPYEEKITHDLTLINLPNGPHFALKLAMINVNALQRPLTIRNNPTAQHSATPDQDPPPRVRFTRHERQTDSHVLTTYTQHSTVTQRPQYTFVIQHQLTDQGRVLERLDVTYNNQISNPDLLNYRTETPVVVLPCQGNPDRLAIYKPIKKLYVPTVYNHLYVVDEHNKYDEGIDLDSSDSGDESAYQNTPSNGQPSYSEFSSSSSSDDDDTPRESTSRSRSDLTGLSRSQTYVTNLVSDVIADMLVYNPPASPPAHGSDSRSQQANSYSNGWPNISGSQSNVTAATTPIVPVDSRFVTIAGRTYSHTTSNSVSYVPFDFTDSTIDMPPSRRPRRSDPQPNASSSRVVPSSRPNSGVHVSSSVSTVPVSIPVGPSSFLGVNISGNPSNTRFSESTHVFSYDRPLTSISSLASGLQTSQSVSFGSISNNDIRSITSSNPTVPNPVRSSSLQENIFEHTVPNIRFPDASIRVDVRSQPSTSGLRGTVNQPESLLLHVGILPRTSPVAETAPVFHPEASTSSDSSIPPANSINSSKANKSSSRVFNTFGATTSRHDITGSRSDTNAIYGVDFQASNSSRDTDSNSFASNMKCIYGFDSAASTSRNTDPTDGSSMAIPIIATLSSPMPSTSMDMSTASNLDPTDNQSVDYPSVNHSDTDSVSVGTRPGTSGVKKAKAKTDKNDEEIACRYKFRKRMRL